MWWETQDSFFLSLPQYLFFLGAKVIVLYALRDSEWSSVKAIGFLSFSFPEHFSELETKQRSQLGWHLFSICNVNQKMSGNMHWTLLCLFHYLTIGFPCLFFWPVPATLSQSALGGLAVLGLTDSYLSCLFLQVVAHTLSKWKLGPRESHSLKDLVQAFLNFNKNHWKFAHQ